MTMEDINRDNELKALEERADKAYQAVFGKKSNLGDTSQTYEQRVAAAEKVLNDLKTGKATSTLAEPIEDTRTLKLEEGGSEPAPTPEPVADPASQTDPQA